MNIKRLFKPSDRYEFDYRLCRAKDGWAQVDTQQDASYYGTWANPFLLKVVSYTEGDIAIVTCDNWMEFRNAIYAIKQFNEENGYRFLGIDPGFNETLKEKFVELGMKTLLH